MSFYKIARGAVSGVFHLLFRIRIEGKENVPQDRALVICANHKSLLDPPLLGITLPLRLRFMAKEELFRNKAFGVLIRSLGAFPIRRGKSDVGALRAAVKMLQSGECVTVFPEGGRSKEPGRMRRGKSGAALIASKAEVDILPVGIDGNYRLFSKMTVRIGTPISLAEFYDRKVETEELQRMTNETVMPQIARLAGVKTYEDRDC